MKFFVPATENAEKAEDLYRAIKKFAAESMGWAIIDRRIRSITFYDKERRAHKRGLVHAIVGEREPCEGLEPVIVILESNTYLVCTPNRGVLRGIPYMVGKDEVIASEDFEPMSRAV